MYTAHNCNMRTTADTGDVVAESGVHSTPSSGGVTTNQGTPGTMPTPFSIGGLSMQFTNFQSFGSTSAGPPIFDAPLQAGGLQYRNGRQGSMEHDPFLAVPTEALDTSSHRHSRLSPTAMAFQPRQQAPNEQITGFENGTKSGVPASGTSNMAENESMKHYIAEKLGSQAPEPNTSMTVPADFFDSSYPMGEFSGGSYTRYLQIQPSTRAYKRYNLEQVLSGQSYSRPSEVVVSKHKHGTTFLGFTDIRDAVNAFGELSHPLHGLVVQYISAKRFAEEACPGDGSKTSTFKGQLLVTATFAGPESDFDSSDVLKSLIQLAKTYGKLLALDITSANFPMIRLRLEYFNLEHANLVKRLNSVDFTGIEVCVEDYSDAIGTYSPSTIGNEPVVVRHEDDDIATLVEGVSLDETPNKVKSRPQGHSSTWTSSRSNSDGTLAQMTPGGGAKAPYAHSLESSGYGQSLYSQFVGLPLQMYQSFTPAHPSSVARKLSLKFQGLDGQAAMHSPTDFGSRVGSGNNAVDLQRIRQGRDVRTTIMLRNIPNKMPQTELKTIVDETNHGEYDFMYLRIDFANNCNVGYAFINFVDPLAIVKFVQARAGRKWNRYNSEKVAEISYATIQGKDCLVQKFRNSSVMLEDPSFRPKIFHTGTGPLAGREEFFPEPDNDSKLRRSIENAGAVGLFAPRAGQYFRDAQRRRRSQYDRGTHHAQLEESYSVVPSQSNLYHLHHSLANVSVPDSLVSSSPRMIRNSA